MLLQDWAILCILQWIAKKAVIIFTSGCCTPVVWICQFPAYIDTDHIDIKTPQLFMYVFLLTISAWIFVGADIFGLDKNGGG